MTEQATPTTEIRNIPLDQLHPHPDNPRLRLRDDVVTQISAEITRSGFGPEHALLVRPVEDGFQIIAGHHRHEAAKRVGLTTVPAWVREMDDDEAFMQLILSNTQGEMSPLEEGHHVATFVGRGHVGGRDKGGLRDYARRLNKNEATLRQRRDAYQVYSRCVGNTHLESGKLGHTHLWEISRAMEDAWPSLVAAWSPNWTVKDTSRKVAEIAKFDVPTQHRPWLPIDLVTSKYLENERPTPTAVARLIEEVDTVLSAIADKGDVNDEAEFRAWLVANTAGEAWDHRKIAEYHAELIKEWNRRRDATDPRFRIFECRAADLISAAEIDAGSVDLIFTDPPYPVEFVDCWSELGELAVKTLKPGGLLVAYTGQYTMPDALDRLRAAGLDYFWCYAVAHDGAFFRMNATHVQCGWKPLLVMRNGKGDMPNWHKDFVSDGSREKSKTATGGEFSGGEWQQSEVEAAYWITELSRPDDLVVDPFVGGGTTAAACKSLGRKFIGCDVDPKAVDSTTARLA